MKLTRYWLGGGILFSAVAVLNILAPSTEPATFLQTFFLHPLFYIFLLPKYFLDNNSWVWIIRWVLKSLPGIVSMAVVTFIYAVVGMILGFVYGKVKDNRIGKILFFTVLIVYIFFQLFFFYTPKTSSTSWDQCFSARSDGKLDENGFNECILSVAKKSKNVENCGYLPEEKIDSCYTLLGYNRQTLSQDNAACNGEEGCLVHLALQRGECEKSLYSDHCYNELSANIRIVARDGKCNLFRLDKYKDLCTKFSAGTITINDLCKDIKEGWLRTACKDESLTNDNVNYERKDLFIDMA